MAARILVVEDNALNLQLVRDLLEVRGHSVDTAADVDEARSRLRDATPDIILLDVQIPGGGGERLLREIRAAGVRLPIIAVTAQAMQGDRERLLAAGFDGYLSKPIDTRSFGPSVEAFLQGVRNGA